MTITKEHIYRMELLANAGETISPQALLMLLEHVARLEKIITCCEKERGELNKIITSLNDELCELRPINLENRDAADDLQRKCKALIHAGKYLYCCASKKNKQRWNEALALPPQ